MARLGYERFGAQGGDWGAMLTTVIAAISRITCSASTSTCRWCRLADIDLTELTAEEQEGLARIDLHVKTGRGYSEEQSTRPQTIGVGLTDSPALQCAWIVEKCYFWTDCDGHPEHVFTKDQMLDNISVYWFTATAASSARYYWENFYFSNQGGPTTEPVTVPSGVSVFPKEIMTISRRMAERRFEDLRWFNRLDARRPLRSMGATRGVRRRASLVLSNGALMQPVFSGVHVIELAEWLFVPQAGSLFADWGADVIKIEHPIRGDGYQGLSSAGTAVNHAGVNAAMELANRGKRSIAVDLKHEDGHAVVLELVATADVVLTSYLPRGARSSRPRGRAAPHGQSRARDRTGARLRRPRTRRRERGV